MVVLDNTTLMHQVLTTIRSVASIHLIAKVQL